MPKLKQVTKEVDTVKKKVDKLVNDCEKLLKDAKAKDKEKKITDYTASCKKFQEDIDALSPKVQELKKEDEPKVDKFEEKQQNEVKRLEAMTNQLTELHKKLVPEEAEPEPEPPEDEDEKKNANTDPSLKEAVKIKEGGEQNEDDDDEDDDEEEDEEEEEGEDDNVADAEDDDESVEEEEIEDEGEEEETEEEDEDDDDELEEEETEEEEEEDEEEDEYATEEFVTGTLRQFIAKMDYEATMPEDLAFSKGEILTVLAARDDGWVEAENEHGQRGMVPSNYLKVYNKYKEVQIQEEGEEDSELDSPEPKTPRSGKLLWTNIKKAVKETSVTDVLHAMGAVPAGFRESTLAKKRAQDQYTMRNYLAPKLSASCVFYQDLFFNPVNNKIRARNVKIQRVITIVTCRQIPQLGTEEDRLEVKKRHVRICLFDGKNVLSNIHIIRVANVDRDQKTWNFNTKATDNMKSIEFADFFVRSNSSESNIGVLFELCMTYTRTKTGQEGEFSMGWVYLPLFETNGAPAANKTYDMFVNGGTPYEKGVDVDPSVGKKEGTSMFRSLMAGNKQPRLTVRVNAATKEQKELLDTLPDVMVSSTSYIQYLSLYRQALTDSLLRDCIDPRSTELIHNPVLATFPSISDQADMMDVLRNSWQEAMKMAKRSEKKDTEALKDLFVKVFLETVYPLCHSASLPPGKSGDQALEEERAAEIKRLQDINKNKKLAYAQLMSPDAMHDPFDIQELAFSVTGPFCVTKA